MNGIPSYSSSYMYLLVYVNTHVVGAEIGSTTVWHVLYVGINPGVNCTFPMLSTGSFLLYTRILEMLTENAACILNIFSSEISHHICGMLIILTEDSCMDN